MDTIALRGPAHPDLLEQLDRRVVKVCDPVTGELADFTKSGMCRLEVGETQVRLYVDRRNGHLEAKFEFSVPTLIWGHNASPTDLCYLDLAVDATLTRLRDQVSGLPTYEQLRLTRADIARDFHVESPRRTLAAIAQVPVSRAFTDVYREGGSVQTLIRGTERWVVRGYDKHEQLLDLARREPYRRDLLLSAAESAKDVLRVECQLNSHLLREAGCNSVFDGASNELLGLAEQFFKRCRFDAVVGGTSRLRTALHWLDSEGRQTDARLLSTLLTAQLHDSPDQMTHNPKDRAKRVAREFDLTALDMLGGECDARRLDFWSGTEVLVGDTLVLDAVA